MVLALMQQKNIFAYAVQETWKRGDALYEKYGFLVIQHGPDVQPSFWRSRYYSQPRRQKGLDCSRIQYLTFR